MAATSVTSVWTAFLNAFRRILAVLGVTSSPRARTATAVRSASGLIPAQAGAPSCDGRQSRLPVPHAAPPRGRALPPTIKQRIRAEAHGSTPSVRRVACVLSPDGAAEDPVPAGVGSTAAGAAPGAPGATETERRRTPGWGTPSS